MKLRRKYLQLCAFAAMAFPPQGAKNKFDNFNILKGIL